VGAIKNTVHGDLPVRRFARSAAQKATQIGLLLFLEEKSTVVPDTHWRTTTGNERSVSHRRQQGLCLPRASRKPSWRGNRSPRSRRYWHPGRMGLRIEHTGVVEKSLLLYLAAGSPPCVQAKLVGCTWTLQRHRVKQLPCWFLFKTGC